MVVLRPPRRTSRRRRSIRRTIAPSGGDATAIYEVSSRTTLVTATALAPLAAFRGSTGVRTRVKEIHLFAITAPTTSGGLGLMRSTALAVTPSGVVTGLPRDTGDAATTAQLETGWGTAPTVGAVGTVLRRFACGPSIGSGVIWTFDEEPLTVPLGSAATGELVLVNLQATAPGTWDMTVVFAD